MVIVINNKLNNVVLTLNECKNDIDITGGTYKMKLVNETTNETYENITITPTISNYRYDLFNLTLTGSSSEDYSLSKIHVEDGFYSYFIYYSDILVEQGFFKVVGDSFDYTEFDSDNIWVSFE
jgi:hypothetical protein